METNYVLFASAGISASIYLRYLIKENSAYNSVFPTHLIYSVTSKKNCPFSNCLHILKAVSWLWEEQAKAHCEEVGLCIIQVTLQEAQHLLLEGLVGKVLDNRVGHILFTDNVQEIISQLLHTQKNICNIRKENSNKNSIMMG